jgi:hypothetical protein
MTLNRSVKEEISGNVAKSFVEQIARFHRIQGSTMYHEAAEYIKSELEKMSLQDIAIEQFPANGAHKYWTYTSPVGWEVRSAELRLVEPEEKLIVTYQDVPQSLHTYSNATPAEGITAELVDVGSGVKPADYEGKDVKGKFVLATGKARSVHELSVYRYGAAGVITDTVTYEMPNVRESMDIPDAHAYQGIWPSADELGKTKFGFSLSKRQGTRLRAMLKSGKPVRLKAKVDARLFSGHEEVVTATIRGSSKPDQEIFLVAHLCHPKPSANDNASGSGLLLEIARTIKRMIGSGKIQQPERTIRFFWVPETLGTTAYLSHHEDAPSRLIAGINLDMVGQNQELCKSTLNLDRTPDSLPSYLNDYVYSLMEQSINEFDEITAFGSSSTFRYATTSFSGGSDHAEFTASSTGVPCIMLLQWPDLYYHTSMDTLDKVSEDTLRRVGWIVTVAVLTLASATAETAFELANQTATRGISRIEESCRKAFTELFSKKRDPELKTDSKELAKELLKANNYYLSQIKHVVWREQEAVRSVNRLAHTSKLTTFIDKCCRDIVNIGSFESERLQEALNFVAQTVDLSSQAGHEEAQTEKESQKLIPKRLFKGTLDFGLLKRELGEKEVEWLQEIEEKDRDFGKKAAEILNFMDGRRNVGDIVEAVSAEYSRTNVEYVLRFLRNLEKIRLISL